MLEASINADRPKHRSVFRFIWTPLFLFYSLSAIIIYFSV
ncbi:hypothetical protein ANACAC_01229 [Anaerostipes caccae L1-92]|uniref:Uncharacterized protein n=1 Tax=Anaerostipes caccae (strain DSM 14662 / CCUG 47493 / JCM 13470 / NCIMB 13811 / L1-92) TaxID=411490 RepID=B0MCD9_ANACD|nr:hypothetical protein ANACAC_01229 [Anaerostipes caccae L1-92]